MVLGPFLMKILQKIRVQYKLHKYGFVKYVFKTNLSLRFCNI